MSYLQELSKASQKPTVSDPSGFSLLKMFKKPASVPSLSQTKEKQDHPYIADFKKQDELKKKEIEENLNQAKLTPEERKFKERLARDKSSFVRVENGKETSYNEGKKNKGFAQVVDVNWSSNKEKQKEKEKEKEKERQREREKKQAIERQREKDLDRERIKQKERREKNREIQKQSQRDKQIYKEKQRRRSRERERERSKERQRQRQRQKEKIRQKQSSRKDERRHDRLTKEEDDYELRRNKKAVYSRPAQEPVPRKKLKHHSRYSDEEQSFDSFLAQDDEEDMQGLKAARKMYGKFYDDQYIKRDREIIRESNFDDLVKEEKVSGAYAAKDEFEDMQRELRRKEEKRKRREREREREK